MIRCRRNQIQSVDQFSQQMFRSNYKKKMDLTKTDEFFFAKTQLKMNKKSN